MNWVSVVVDEDDVQPYFVLGPYDTKEQAWNAGDELAEYMEEHTMKGHAHPHAWDSFALQVRSLDDAKADDRIT